MRFYLGTHKPHWLERVDVPLFISHRQLRTRARLPRARGPWALDSGAYSELSSAGRWVTSVDEYVEAVARYAGDVGSLEWAAPMDWMCEPHMLERTGLGVAEHQERTVANFLELRGRGPFVPVLQGWELGDYLRCVDLYAQAGVDLAGEPLVGLGTICRRQGSEEIRLVVGALAELGLRMHGFGVKKLGLPAIAHLVESADSMAWSVYGRFEWAVRQRRMCGGEHAGGCANCLPWALAWRADIVESVGLFAEAA